MSGCENFPSFAEIIVIYVRAAREASIAFASIAGSAAEFVRVRALGGSMLREGAHLLHLSGKNSLVTFPEHRKSCEIMKLSII